MSIFFFFFFFLRKSSFRKRGFVEDAEVLVSFLEEQVKDGVQCGRKSGTVAYAAIPSFANSFVNVTRIVDVFRAQVTLHNMTQSCWVPPDRLIRETEVFRISGPVVVHAYSGSVILGGKYILYNSSLNLPTEKTVPPTLYGESLNRCSNGTTKLVVSLGDWGGSFQHTVQDIVDVMGVFWDELDEDTLFLINHSLDKGKHWQREELFEILNWTHRLVYPQEGFYSGVSAMMVRKDKFLPNTMSGIRRIRKEIQRVVGCEGMKRDKILVWTRVPGNARWLQNEGEVVQAVDSWIRGLNISATVLKYDPGKVSLRESFRRSCSAIGVIYVHGGAQYHALTVHESAWLLEMVPHTGSCTTGAEYIIPLGMRLYQLGVAGNRDNSDGVRANLRDLSIVLEQIRREKFL